MQALEHCLLQLDQALSGIGADWALGGSMLMHYKGLVDKPRDIDIVIARKDADQAESALSSLGEKQAVQPSDTFATERFLRYRINGVDVDIMAGIVIRHDDGDYRYSPSFDGLERISLHGRQIPLSPLEDWYILYLLMPGRAHRVEAIESYFRAHGADGQILRRRLLEPLPETVKVRLRHWLSA